MKYLYLSLLTFLSVDAVIAQSTVTIRIPKLSIELSSGINLFSVPSSFSGFERTGEFSSILSNNLSVARIGCINRVLFYELGLGVNHNLARINELRTADLLTTLPQRYSSKTDIRLHFLDGRLPLLVGRSFGRKKSISVLAGGFVSYRMTNFSSSRKETILYFGYLNQINPDGSQSQVWRELPLPEVVNSEEQNLELPANKIQFGLTAKAKYTLSKGSLFSNLPVNLGFIVDHFLSTNEVWEGHELTMRVHAFLGVRF